MVWPDDTDVLDGHEMVELSNFCPPIGGAIATDHREAARLGIAPDPNLVCPVHYNSFQRVEANGQAFAEGLASDEVAAGLENSGQQ
jgi:L-ascorbate metabolism protein UlaG (beta-lactamase superfamily)